MKDQDLLDLLGVTATLLVLWAVSYAALTFAAGGG